MLQIFWSSPLASLAFISLLLCFLSLWVYRSSWLWGGFLFLSLCLAYEANILKPVALLPILVLLGMHWLLSKGVSGYIRLILVVFVVLLSSTLAFHVFPGFSNWKILDTIQVGCNAYPYNLWLNFDKPFIGLFILIWGLPLIHRKTDGKTLIKLTLPITALGIVILLFLAIYSHQIAWDVKLPSFTLVWMLINLFFVVIPEEAFFRGFIQEELSKRFGASPVADVGAVFLSALLFTLAHIMWIGHPTFLLLIFVAGIIYGAIYQLTRAIESAIFCHFVFNAVHFIFFTYPVLQSSILRAA